VFRFLDGVNLVFHEAGHVLFWTFRRVCRRLGWHPDAAHDARYARARRLPPLGGEDVSHDWSYILGRLNLLQQDQVIGHQTLPRKPRPLRAADLPRRGAMTRGGDLGFLECRPVLLP
jgi:hypothetical protein